jgi:hypothetical protein
MTTGQAEWSKTSEKKVQNACTVRGKETVFTSFPSLSGPVSVIYYYFFLPFYWCFSSCHLVPCRGSRLCPVLLSQCLCCFPWMIYSSALKTEGTGSSEMIKLYQTTRLHISEDMSLHTHQLKNLRSHSSIIDLKFLVTCAEQLLPSLTFWYISFLYTKHRNPNLKKIHKIQLSWILCNSYTWYKPLNYLPCVLNFWMVVV